MTIEHPHAGLGARERQIMNVVYRLGSATAAEVQKHLPDPPGYSGVRKILSLLEEKGHLRHEQDGRRYVYHPVTERESARRSVLTHLVDTFFDGSVEAVVSTLLRTGSQRLTPEEMERLAAMIEDSREEAG